MHIYKIQKDGNDEPIYMVAEMQTCGSMEMQTYRIDFWTQWRREKMEWFESVSTETYLPYVK